MNNPILKDHFLHPRNVGTPDNHTHAATVRSDTCNDIVKVALRLEPDGLVGDVGVQVFGCGYAIAGASLAGELARGERLTLVPALLRDELERVGADIPERHRSCIGLAIKAMQRILDDIQKQES